MTLFGSLNKDTFILSIALGLLGVAFGGFNPFLTLGAFAVVMIAAWARLYRNTPLIPSNVELGAMIFLVGWEIHAAGVSGSAMLGGSVFGGLLGFAAAAVALYYVQEICRFAGDLCVLVVAACDIDPNHLPIIRIIALVVLYLLTLLISPFLGNILIMLVWAFWTQRRAGQLTGWNDTTN